MPAGVGGCGLYREATPVSSNLFCLTAFSASCSRRCTASVCRSASFRAAYHDNTKYKVWTHPLENFATAPCPIVTVLQVKPSLISIELHPPGKLVIITLSLSAYLLVPGQIHHFQPTRLRMAHRHHSIGLRGTGYKCLFNMAS